MMDEFEHSKRAGIFTISPDKNVYGELTYAGPNTSLYLWDKENFDTRGIQGRSVKGTLHDLTKITLLRCVTASVPGCATSGVGRYYFANVFPHFVLHGDCQITQDEKVITEVRFLVDDASVLFYDFDAFGSLVDARPFIDQIVRANRLEREIPAGPNPEILYFAGKYEILSVDTILGRVSASHHLNHGLGGPEGVYLKSRIFIIIRFKEACSFDETISHTLTLLRFVELLVGRPQNLLSLNIGVNSGDTLSRRLKVYWSMPPKRDAANNPRPHPADILVNACRHPDAFARMLSNWLDREKTWHDARLRFSNSFAQQKYSIDRLIGSANMFDILPGSAVPADVPLSEELRSAEERCRNIFEKLPNSPERNSVLSALGRIGKSALKNKIRHRGNVLVNAIGRRLPSLFMVTDEAVNCRNHYVHGSEPTFDYNDESDLILFFTDTLEFVFAASDLIEAGWDARAWSTNGTSMSHPFARYLINYPENLRKLQSLLA